MNSSWTDLGAYFDDLWREVNYSKASEPKPLDGKVRLDCTGELIDADSLGVALVRHGAAGEQIEFVCPCCGAVHESARFT